MSEGLLTEEEVKSYLGADSEEVTQLQQKGKLTAYRIGGAFVRYRKDQVVALRSGTKFRLPDQFERNWFDVIRDFIRFYGIYIALFGAICLLITYFLKA